MARKNNRRKKKRSLPVVLFWLVRRVPAWLLVLIVMMCFPTLPETMRAAAADGFRSLQSMLNRPAAGRLAPLFAPSVHHWEDLITRWADAHDIDPNLLATVMQIESCGHPTAVSTAGARGLFQVMPFHFSPEEDMLEPETNARRGASFLAECLNNWAGGDPAGALACYNGGPGVLSRDFSTWAAETQRYYLWGLGIYHDANQNHSSSETLNTWMNAGGAVLCDRAESTIGM